MSNLLKSKKSFTFSIFSSLIIEADLYQIAGSKQLK